MNLGAVRSKLRPIVPPPPANTNAPGLHLVDDDTPDPPSMLDDDSEPGGTVTLPASTWTRYASKLFAALAIIVFGAMIRRGDHEPNEPEDSDVERLQDALAEGLSVRFGDADAPWWMGGAMALGGMYAAMRIGAARLDVAPVTPLEPGKAAPPAPPPTGFRAPPAPPPISGTNGV